MKRIPPYIAAPLMHVPVYDRAGLPTMHAI